MMRHMLIALGLLCGSAGVSPAVAQRSHYGVHGGYDLDNESWLIGAQLHLPLSQSIELYPSFDYYLVNTGSLVGLNVDLHFRTPGAPLYFGGGLNNLRDTDRSDTGFNLFGGFETRYGKTHPYVEVRGLFHDTTTLQLMFGLNVTLY